MANKGVNCIRGMLKTTALTDAELERILQDFRAKTREAVQAAGNTNEQKIANEIAQREAARIRLEAAQQKRNAANNAIFHRKWLDDIAAFPSDKPPSDAVNAKIEKSNVNAPGSRDSITSAQASYESKWVLGLAAGIEKAGLRDFISTSVFDGKGNVEGVLDKDAFFEMAEIDKPNSEFGKTKNKLAMAFAKELRRAQEWMRNDLNSHGATIGKVENFIITQDHNLNRVAAVPLEEWRADAIKTYGQAKTYEGLGLKGDPIVDKPRIDAFWATMYNDIVSGHWEHAKAADTGFRGVGDKAKGLSTHRVLHAVNTELAWEYHKKYGRYNLYNSVVHTLRKNAKVAGLMEKAGTNPEALILSVIDDVKADRRAKGLPADPALDTYTIRLLDLATGKADVPSDVNMARIGADLRAAQSTMKLGGAGVTAAFGDTMTMAMSVRDTMGRNMFEALGETISARAEMFGDPAKARQFMAYVGVGAQTVTDRVSAQTGVDGVMHEAVHRTQQAYFALNGLDQVTSNGDAAGARIFSAMWGEDLGKSIDQLRPEMQRTLSNAGITPQMWDVARQYGHTMYADMKLFVPDAMRDAPPEAFDVLIGDRLDAINVHFQGVVDRIGERMAQVKALGVRIGKSIGETGEKGQKIADAMAMNERINQMQKAATEELKATFDKPFGRAVDRVARLVERDTKAFVQNEQKLRSIEKEMKRAKKDEPGNWKRLGKVFDALDDAKADFGVLVDELRSGTIKDITAPARTAKKIERLRKVTDEIVDDIEAEDRGSKHLENLKQLQAWAKDFSDADYRSIVNEQRAKVVQHITGKVASLAKTIERENAANRRFIKGMKESLQLSKKAEPALLELLLEGERKMAELHEMLTKTAQRFEDAVNKERYAAERSLESRLRAMMIDQVQKGVIRGGLREKATALQGTRPGTVVGEALRFIMQFKQFPLAFVQQILGGIAEEDRMWRIPYALLMKTINDPRGAGVKTLSLVLQMTAMGYLAMLAKDTAKGKEPPDPTNPTVWRNAFVTGGAGGIFADLLFAQAGKSYHSTALELAGPMVGTASDALDLVFQSRDATGALAGWGDAEFPSANKWLGFFKENTPGLNLFYIRGALDYLFLYELQEQLAPGSVRRMEDRLREEKGQEFFYSPSEHVAQ